MTSLKEKLTGIRKAEPAGGKRKAVLASVSFAAGIALGIFSKWLDSLALDPAIRWQSLLAGLDLGIFLSELAPWLFAAVLIARFSPSAPRAALNVFLFFAGMCAAYHICSILFAGFDPGRYMLIWYGITLLSPLLAAMCWYAAGTGTAALVLDMCIMAVMTLACFSVGMVYINFRGALYLLVWAASAALLYREPKQLAACIAGGAALALLLSPLWPFR